MAVELHPGEPVIFLESETLNDKRFGQFGNLDFGRKVHFFLILNVKVEVSQPLSSPGMMSEEHLVEKDPDRPDVALDTVDWPAILDEEYLRSHRIGGSTATTFHLHLTSHKLGQPEVSQFEGSVGVLLV